MSELKAHKAYNRWIDEEMPTPNDDLICNEVYLKSEADKAIADLEESHKKEVGQLLIEIIELKKERRWRKFPEEKPKWGEEVLVVDDESKKYIVRFSHDMKWISWGKMNTCESNCVKYWMPLPKFEEK